MTNHRTPSLLTAVLLAAALSSCNQAVGQTRAAPDRTPAVKVELATASEIKVPRELTVSGTLRGNEQAKVAAGVMGKVVATFVERGQLVKKGAVLAELDARAVRSQAEEAAAQLESLKVQRTQAELDCARSQRLFADGAVPKAEYDRVQSQCAASKWSVAAAEARKALSAQALRDTQIRAPFTGIIVERTVTAGEYVRADSPVATLVAVDPLRVELTVPEAEVTRVRQGMSVAFQTATSDGQHTYRGNIRYVGPSVRQESRDALVEAVVDNGAHALRPGMFVTAKLVLGERTLPGVPASAVRVEGTQRHVFVAVGGKLEDRLVRVGEPSRGLVPIADGLKSGELVVATLSPDLRDGVRVQ